MIAKPVCVMRSAPTFAGRLIVVCSKRPTLQLLELEEIGLGHFFDGHFLFIYQITVHWRSKINQI
jgi:hypothetical protein